jgi:hypothetical protein
MMSYCSACGQLASRSAKFCTKCGRPVVASPPGNTTALGCATIAALIPVAFMVTCFLRSPGPSLGGTASSASRAGSDCKRYGQGRDGWLVDHDRRGEVALWAKPVQRASGNSINATVQYPPDAIGAGMITTVTDECFMPDGIIYYHIQFDENRAGWVDVDYLTWNRP